MKKVPRKTSSWTVYKSYRGSKKQKVMGFVKEKLLKKETESTIVAAQDQAGPIYKQFEKCGLRRKCSIYLLCMWCY